MKRKLQLLSYPIAVKLKQLRKRNSLTQEEMALILGVNQSQYSKYERATQSISCCHICHLCARFNVKPSYFFEFLER